MWEDGMETRSSEYTYGSLYSLFLQMALMAVIADIKFQKKTNNYYYISLTL